MGGGLMQLVAYGAQDIYLTGNPQITFFKVVYRRHTNFSMESIQQTWNGNSNSANGRCTATISRNGDLVHKLYFQIDTGNRATGSASFASSNPGAAWIDTVSVEIGGQTIDKQYGSWLETWAELTEVNPTGVIAGVNENASTVAAAALSSQDYQNTLFQRMAGMGGVCNNASNSLEKLNSGRYFYVPLQFWFCRNPGLALPLIALQYHEVKIIVEHKFGAIFPSTGGPDQQLWADYIYLDTDERRRFAQVSHEYLIEQLQMQDASTSSKTVDLNFNHPVKELIWTGKWDDTSAVGAGATGQSRGTNAPLAIFDSNAVSADTFLLKLNGHDRFAPRPVTYFTQAQVHQYHSGPGGLNTQLYTVTGESSGSFVNNFDDSIAVYSFALKPEEHQPSGTCNFSRIDSAQLIRSDNVQAMRIYAVNYNVLRIMSGMGGLAYSN
jgi:hypothetical protein